MRRLIRVPTLTAALLLLTACAIGNGRICGPQTPMAYCDAAAMQALMNPSSYRDYWAKEGGSEAEKRLDWVSCGGLPDGRYVPSSAEVDLWRQAADIDRILLPRQRADAEFQRCLLRKGLRWTGGCNTRNTRAMPACVARSESERIQARPD